MHPLDPQCALILQLIDDAETLGPGASPVALLEATSRLRDALPAFASPAATSRLAELDNLVAAAASEPLDFLRARVIVDAIQESLRAAWTGCPPDSASLVGTAVQPAAAVASIQALHSVTPAPQPMAAIPIPGALTDVDSTALTILIAEDDPDVVRIVDSQLRGAGYQTVLAFDGADALEAVRQHSPALVVLDLMMPRVDGFEVLTRINESASTRPRVVVLSGRGREADAVRAFELGADDYMTKPFHAEEFLARIVRLLKFEKANEPVLS